MESLNPIELNEIPEVGSLVTQGVSINEVYYVDLQIIQFLMEGRVKMSTDDTRFNIGSDVSKVSLAPVHQPSLSLAYIHFTTSFADEAVDQIRAFAANILFARVGAPRGGASNLSREVHACTISTILGFAHIGFYLPELAGSSWEFGTN